MNRADPVYPGGWLIGVTGGIGCGKSEVGRALAEAGVDVQEADDVAHAVLAPDGAAYAGVVERFGPDILDADGVINRARLGERVFASDEERAVLNALVHPHVHDARAVWSASIHRQNRVGAAIVPLLFEVGLEKDFDCVWCVRSTPDLVERRLLKRGWTAEQIAQRLAAQWSVDRKAALADAVIDNNKDLMALKQTIWRLLNDIVKKETRHHG